MQCPVCNKDVAPQASFCNHCGASITPAAAAPEYSPVAGYSAGSASQQPPYAPVSGSGAPASAVPPQSSYSAPGASNLPPGYPPSGYPPPAGYPPSTGATGLSDNTAAALSYLTIIPAILFLVIEPYNKVPLIRFHSFQSIGLFVVAVILQIAISFAQIALHFIPLSWVLFGMVHLLLSLALFIFWLIAIIKASKGEWYKLPLIGDFADKQARS